MEKYVVCEVKDWKWSKTGTTLSKKMYYTSGRHFEFPWLIAFSAL
jgi:hypothetical protein